MEKITLIVPQKEHERQAEEYVKEFAKYGSDVYGSARIDKFITTAEVDGFDRWLQSIKNHGEELVNEGWTPSDTYFAIRESDNKIVGTINIRHIFDEADLKEGGSHIGFAIRPTERLKGYAITTLKLGIQECAKLGYQRILVGHDESNIASKKTILRCGGVFSSELDEDGNKLKRYWIYI